MPGLRVGRRKYYELFSHFYDAFIRLHARQDEDDTRQFPVVAAHLPEGGRFPSLHGSSLRNSVGACEFLRSSRARSTFSTSSRMIPARRLKAGS